VDNTRNLIHCASFKTAERPTNAGSSKPQLPTKRELITWASSHTKTTESLQNQIAAILDEERFIGRYEIAKLLREALHHSYATGALHADLAEGRFRAVRHEPKPKELLGPTGGLSAAQAGKTARRTQSVYETGVTMPKTFGPVFEEGL